MVDESVSRKNTRVNLKHLLHSVVNVHDTMQLLASNETKHESRPIVYLDFTINGGNHLRVTFRLYNDLVPLTAENFRQLCTHEKGFGYRGNRIHRIVPNFVVQGGDITSTNGTGGLSIYKGTSHGDLWGNFKDERFLSHNKKGLLSMANKGPNTNSSQFFVTMKECPKLDGKHVVFGEVVDGFEVIERIEKCSVDKDSVIIAECGQIGFSLIRKKLDRVCDIVKLIAATTMAGGESNICNALDSNDAGTPLAG